MRKLSILFLILSLCATIYAAERQTAGRLLCGSRTDLYVPSGPLSITPQLCANIALWNITLNSSTAKWTTEGNNRIWRPETSFGQMTAVARDYTLDYYEAQYVQFKSPAEHELRNERASLELQIYFKNKAAGRLNAVFTYPINHTAAPAYAFKQRGEYDLFDDFTDTTNDLTVDFTKLENRTLAYPQFYRYNGSFGASANCESVTYYVYSSILYFKTATIENIRNALPATTEKPFAEFVYNGDDQVKFSQEDVPTNARDPVVLPEASSFIVERFCYREFWRNHIPYNYGLWFAIGMACLFFCCQLCTPGQKPIRDPDYKESGWTHHPLVSLKRVSNDIFTRRTRFTVLWMNLTNNAIICAGFVTSDHRFVDDDGIQGWEVFLYGLAGAVFGGIGTYLWGYFLRKYYIAKHAALLHKGEPAKADKHNEDANFYLYVFYFMTFAWMWGGNWFFIWMMNLINPIDHIGVTGQSNVQRSLRWMGAFLVSVGLDWLVLDVFFAILALARPFRRLFAWKGYIYDDLCHQTYLMSAKED